MSQNVDDVHVSYDPDHVHDWFDLSTLGDVDAEGNVVVGWICYTGGERTETDPEA